jgi:hypothetical protein
MTERIINTVSILSALFLLWICISRVDVISDNTRPDSQHSDLNFFVAITELWEDK